MSLPASGTISLANLQTIFGGANPIGFNEYYLNANPALTAGVSGIPNIGSSISLNQFYGKSKYVPPSSTWPPAAVQSTYGNFGLYWGVGLTNLEWVAGASGINTTRTGGSTFNNLGFDNYANRPKFLNYQNLILQAKPGDALQFQVRNGANYGSDYEVNSLALHLGGGWFSIGSVGGYGGHTDTFNYTISTTQAASSYGILAYNSYSSAGSTTWASANFYSLQISN